MCKFVCEEKHRTHSLLAYLPQTQCRMGRVGVISESIQKIIHCKYIIYIYTYLNIFTNIPSTIHYTVYFFFSRIIGKVYRENWKRNASYYKINRGAASICALLLFLCFVSRSSVSQSFSYLSSSSSPLFLRFTSVHTFLQEYITVLECQPLELDHQTINVVDCKNKT